MERTLNIVYTKCICFCRLRAVSLKLSTISTSFDGGFEENSDFVVLDLCIGDPEEGNLKYYNDNLV